MIELIGQRLSLDQIATVAAGKGTVTIGSLARARTEAARRVIETALSEERIVYGVNTGFGRLASVRISASELEALQLNLVRSHACGLGPPLSASETRAIILLRANALASGHSGVRFKLIEHLVLLLEHGIHPLIPSKGSVGASGDLAPLAHLALAVIGEGEVMYRNQRMPSRRALDLAGLCPQSLEPKEGLALLNGTQAMTAVGALALHRAVRLIVLADLAGAMTLEALNGTPTAFDDRIHAVRPHPGQRAAAAHLRALLAEGEVRRERPEEGRQVQDAYSLRCMPQVHGAVRGVLAHACNIVQIETGSATDNPLVFWETGDFLSGGNFHGAPLAMAFDYAAIAIADLMSISERRIERLVNPDLNNGLPPFLTAKAGISSGFMIAHVAAVSLLNEAKVLAHPASVDNLPTSAGQEDHVSMGMTAATKLRAVVESAELMLAIEFLAAAQGLDYRLPHQAAREVRLAYEMVRKHAAPVTHDRSLAGDIERLALALQGDDFERWTRGLFLDVGEHYDDNQGFVHSGAPWFPEDLQGLGPGGSASNADE